MKKKINIEGMSCGHCVAHVKEALQELKGVSSVEVSLEEKNATIETTLDNNTLISAIDEAGYDAISIEEI
ncbi:heavy-metal-associated domain-containing protein [Clostridium sp. MB05]|jgi:copper chaperone|uniref:heavy-metal-associated domain-containing protein n=1 Tax=Clostridium sp. MB05 TaxID=3376682 RepID=UPI003982126B